jgi:hypothetical protein
VRDGIPSAAEIQYREILERAAVDPLVVGVVVFGSRAAGPYAEDRSDVDAFVVVDASEDEAGRWQTAHGSPVEVWAVTLHAFRKHGLPGDPTAWNRPAFLRARVDLDKSDGEIAHIVDRKRRLDPEEARTLAAVALDDAINSIYRGLRNLEGGRVLAGRLDALESVAPLLTCVFALERRVRPFNKWLEYELDQEPLSTAAFSELTARIGALIGDPTPGRLRAAFRMLEEPARNAGHGPVIDGWEPDVAWLRGEPARRS